MILKLILVYSNIYYIKIKMNIFFCSSLFRVLFKTVNRGCVQFTIKYLLVVCVLIRPSCSKLQWNIRRIITIYYVPGLQLKNKCNRNRRIRTYTPSRLPIIYCVTINYLYRIPIKKLKWPFTETINYIRPSLIILFDSSPRSSIICPQTNHTPDQFLLLFPVDRNTIGHDWRNNRDKYMHILLSTRLAKKKKK